MANKPSQPGHKLFWGVPSAVGLINKEKDSCWHPLHPPSDTPLHIQLLAWPSCTSQNIVCITWGGVCYHICGCIYEGNASHKMCPYYVLQCYLYRPIKKKKKLMPEKQVEVHHHGQRRKNWPSPKIMDDQWQRASLVVVLQKWQTTPKTQVLMC